MDCGRSAEEHLDRPEAPRPGQARRFHLSLPPLRISRKLRLAPGSPGIHGHAVATLPQGRRNQPPLGMGARFHSCKQSISLPLQSATHMENVRAAIEGNIMRKSIWLLSAGIFAISAPAFAQDTTQGSTSTAAEGPTEAAAVDPADAEDAPQQDDAIIVTATRRNEALSDVPLAVSAVTGETLQNTGAVDIRGLNQVSPSLLVSSTSSEAGASVARSAASARSATMPASKVRSRCSSTAFIAPAPVGADRARPGRSHRGPARAAGHLVRPQRFGRPDSRHHRQAALHAARSTARRRSAITT